MPPRLVRGGGPLLDAPHPSKDDVAPGYLDVFVSPAGLRGGEGVDREVSRPADASIAVLQAPLAATLPHPHARGSGRRGGGRRTMGLRRGLLRLKNLKTFHS